MIIWSGLGILIPLLTIFGVFAGTAISARLGHPAMGLGLGLGMAAIANWGLWQLVYPKRPRILLDPSTGRPVVLVPRHDLFFIPARVWTWLLAILALPLLLIGGVGEHAIAKEDALPGCKEFKAANKLIATNSTGTTHGNSEAAKTAAAEFSSSMKTTTAATFTGGSKQNPMNGGDFLTYCEEGADAIVFLCHVPSLHSYKSDKVKDGLDKIAWTAANLAAAKMDPERKKKLLVGLRGVATYGSVMQGQSGAQTPATQSHGDDTAGFHPAFAPLMAKPGASPADK